MSICNLCGASFPDSLCNCPVCTKMYHEDLANGNIPCPEIISKENFSWTAWRIYKITLLEAEEKKWSDDFTREHIRQLMREYENAGNAVRSEALTQSQVEQAERNAKIKNLGNNLFKR